MGTAPTLSSLAADINENHELARMYVGQVAVTRRRCILWQAEEAKNRAENQTGLTGMDAADDSEIDMEIVEACLGAALAWQHLGATLRERMIKRRSKKPASTLPQDGRSEVAVDDDAGDIPEFLRR